MAAPSGTVWGSIVKDYGRIGIYKSLSSNSTTTTVTVEVWFWSKFSVSDSNNTFYFDNLASSGSATTSKGSINITTTSNSGGWSEVNQKKIASYSYSYTRGTSAVTRYLYAAWKNIDRVGGTMYASTTFSVPKLDSYTVTYNANGGSGAPSSQTKWYGKTLKLSTTKPTRSGYSFQGWATSSSATTATYAAGADYAANSAVTLYAVWKANTYTVSYNANGGSGAPSSQTKTHDKSLTLSSTKPTRANHTFKGWGTSASATTVSYAPGASYTANAAVTLYAIWSLAYLKPRITNLSIDRCDSDGTINESGMNGLVTFDWACDLDIASIKIQWKLSTGSSWTTKTFTASGKSNIATCIIGNNALSTEQSYDVKVIVTDGNDSSDVSGVLGSIIFAMDCLPENKGVAFGKAAELENTAEFEYEAKFNSPVYGKALGMDRLPAIPKNSDFNDYIDPGCYAVQSNAIAETCANIPVDRAGRLEVWSSTGEGIRSEQWSYIRQRFIPYNSSNAVWERDISRNASNVWTYYDWWRSSLTPTVAERVYSKAAMTVALSANTVLGAVNTYTRIPFDKAVLSTNSRLTLASNSIRIGSNVDHIKVSGQVLVSPGSTNGLRHIRIQKVSGGSTTSVVWLTVYVTASHHTIFPLTPAIVSVKEGDLLTMVFYTGNSSDSISSGSSGNGWQTYLTVEEL